MEVKRSQSVSRHEDTDQTTDNKRVDWRKRLRLRKSTLSSLPMTEEVKVTPEENKKPSLNENEHVHMVDTACCKLTFTCSDCMDSTLFSPSGLLHHFKVFHEGKGNPPSFSCDMCRFSSPDISALQRHRMKHRNCKFPCEICNNSVFYTPSQLTKHCKTQHTLNGQYHCGKCSLSTKDLNLFMHHPCPQSITLPSDGDAKLDIKPLNQELNVRRPAAVADVDRKDVLLKHEACRRSWSRKNWWKKRESQQKQNNNNNNNIPDFKLLPPKQETQWAASGLLPFSAAGLLDANGTLLNPAKTLEETQQFLERSVNLGKKWPLTLKADPEIASLSSSGPRPKAQECSTVTGLSNPGKNKLSGLMEKNKISVPPDCTTKVIGFKMVDGKKHLVLKVIPSSAKSAVPPDTEQCPGISVERSNNVETVSQAERPADIASKNGSLDCYDTTSGLEEAEKRELVKTQHGKSTNVPQVHNTENDHTGENCAIFKVADARAQLNFSGRDGTFKVANKRKSVNQPTSQDVACKETCNRNGSAVPEEVKSLRQTNIQTVYSYSLDSERTNKHTGSQEAAVMVSAKSRHQLITICGDSGCESSLASNIPSYLGALEEPQISTLLSAKDRPISSRAKKPAEDTVVQSPLSDLNDEKMEKTQPAVVSNSPTSQERESTFEINGINPTLLSPYRHAKTTGSLFNSPSDDGDLLFQDSSIEYTNNTGPGDALVPLDHNSTTETLPSAFAMSFLEDSCHNPDLFQTIEELPVTTINHLLDDPDITSRGITNQSVQTPLQPRKAIQSSRSNMCPPRRNEPAMNRKRPGERSDVDFEIPDTKSRKQTVQNEPENHSFTPSVRYWEPVAQNEERCLRLLPFCSSQPVKVPCQNQPVVVLNHPDTDIPEVSNLMRFVHRHKGAVQRVVLSRGTLKALSELKCDNIRNLHAANARSPPRRKAWPEGTVKERFILKLKLKRVCGNKFKVVSTSKTNTSQPVFRCWFCGRLFRNQELWVGHGQRHLMEATRDWNKLFKSDGQNNSPIQPYCH